MKMPILRIGQYEFKIPIVLGSMGVRITKPAIVGPVAEEGMMATMTTMVLADMDGAMKKEVFISTSKESLIQEIGKLKAITDKPFAINVMGALSNADDLVATAIEYGASIVVYGAGMPMKLPGLPAVKDHPEVALVPIISKARAANIIIESWYRLYKRFPDALILEGNKAGGHLGFQENQLDDSKFKLENILKEMLEVVKPLEKKYEKRFPIIVAGGIFTGEEIAKMLLLGASGVQMATRFVATYECPVHINFKQAYVDAKKEDIVIIKSPVGMIGRAIKNKFLADLDAGNIPKPFCPYHCIHSCKRSEAGYCIAERLINAFEGDIDNGLIFAGANVHQIKEIVSVKELIDELVAGIENSKLELVTV